MVSDLIRGPIVMLCVLASFTTSVRGESTQERRERIDRMTVSEKEALQRKDKRFHALSETERKRLQDMHDELSKAPDGGELQQIMVRYYAWLKTLPAGLRKDVLSMPPDERIAKIRDMLKYQSIERFKRLARTTLEDRDVSVIKMWIDKFMERHKDQLMQSLTEQQRMQLDSMNTSRHPNAWKYMVMGALLRGETQVTLSPVQIPDEIDELKSQLSPSAKELLENETDPARQLLVIRSWVGAAHFSDIVHRNMKPVSKEELMRFLREEASEAERAELEGLTAEQARREAERMYYQNEMKKNWEKMRDRQGSSYPDTNEPRTRGSDR